MDETTHFWLETGNGGGAEVPIARTPVDACGARKPGWENGPAIGRHRIPCVLDPGHDDDHRDGLGQTWPQAEEPQDPDDQVSNPAYTAYLHHAQTCSPCHRALTGRCAEGQAMWATVRANWKAAAAR